MSETPATEYRVTHIVAGYVEDERVPSSHGVPFTNYADAQRLRDALPIAAKPRIEARLVTAWLPLAGEP